VNQADIARQTSRNFEPQLRRCNSRSSTRNRDAHSAGVLAEMEWPRHYDRPSVVLHRSRNVFACERERVEGGILRARRDRFQTSNSNPQLREILFDKLNLPVLKKTQSGASTDASVPPTARRRWPHPAGAADGIPAEITENWKAPTSTRFRSHVHPKTIRVHTSFTQTMLRPGRLVIERSDLQNIPIRRELGATFGVDSSRRWTLLAADYFANRARDLLAHLSDDTASFKRSGSGGDIHVQTAAPHFDVPLDAVTKDMRARAKTITSRRFTVRDRTNSLSNSDHACRGEGVHREVLRALSSRSRDIWTRCGVCKAAWLCPNDLQIGVATFRA